MMLSNGQVVGAAPEVADEYLEVADLRAMFGIGDSKARLLMDVLPHVRIGRKHYVLRSSLMGYLAEHGTIDLTWPKRKRGRR